MIQDPLYPQKGVPMEQSLIRTAGPSITQREIDYVTDAVKNGWNANWNGYLGRFEKAMSDYLGIRHAMTTSSCTGALHLAVASLGIGSGDEVIVPDLSWVATASAVAYTGATPVMCDIVEGSWCIDPVAAAELITPRTKAIMPVHLYGHPADMPAVVQLAKKHGLKVIEDAAPAVGAAVSGRKVGTWGDCSAFSFQGAKMLVTGEGGMLVTNNDEVFERARVIGDHGRHPTIPLWAVEVGFKYKMSNMQAAMGLAQLERIDELIERKRYINARYRANLAGVNSFAVTDELPGCHSIHWMTSIEVFGMDDQQRSASMLALRKLRVDTRPVFKPMSSMPMFHQRAENPVARRIGGSAINLPCAHDLTDGDIDYVSETVMRLFGG
jgi:perosamine synthetase